jgi:hypothetical protein
MYKYNEDLTLERDMVGITNPLQYRRLFVRVTVAVMSRKLDMDSFGCRNGGEPSVNRLTIR